MPYVEYTKHLAAMRKKEAVSISKSVVSDSKAPHASVSHQTKPVTKIVGLELHNKKPSMATRRWETDAYRMSASAKTIGR